MKTAVSKASLSEKFDMATSAAKMGVGIGKSVLSGSAVADIPTHATNAIDFCAKVNKAYFKELGTGETEGKFKSFVRPFFESAGKFNDMLGSVDSYAKSAGETLNASEKLALAAGMFSTNGMIDKHTMGAFKAAGSFANDVTSVFRKGIIPKTPSDVRDRVTSIFDAGKQVGNFSKEWLTAKYGSSDIPKEISKNFKMPERAMAWAGRHSAIIKEHNDYKAAMKEYNSNIKKGIEAIMPSAPERKYGFIDRSLNVCGKINDFLGKSKSVNGIYTSESENVGIVDYGLNHGTKRLMDFSKNHDVVGTFRRLFRL